MVRAGSVLAVLGGFAILLAMLTAAAAAPDTSYVSGKCNAYGIPQGSPFWGHLGSLLAELVDNTPYSDGFYFKTRYGGGNAPAFGLAGCPASVSPPDCHQCLAQLSTDIWRICNSALGAQVWYNDCWIHYECYYF